MPPIQTFYSLSAKAVIQSLEIRNMRGFYCETAEEALAKALSFAALGSTVAWGESQTLEDIGLKQALKSRSYNIIDRDAAIAEEDRMALDRLALSCDCFFTGANAITLDGKLVNMDCNGNRAAALIFGPKNVIVITGMNKVMPDEEAAVARVRKQAAPHDNMRLKRDTPCATTGLCFDCLEDECLCSNLVITRRSCAKNRIKVILIGEDLGY
ncbi:MAG: lactate utilization protein [Clostridiales bacterium]|jgi:L-lactate utilization protein LutB|nr:lactate utilization protein [Clostridiales bacterium]